MFDRALKRMREQVRVRRYIMPLHAEEAANSSSMDCDAHEQKWMVTATVRCQKQPSKSHRLPRTINLALTKSCCPSTAHAERPCGAGQYYEKLGVLDQFEFQAFKGAHQFRHELAWAFLNKHFSAWEAKP